MKATVGSKPFVSVRWPFRVLAALLLATTVGAGLALALSFWPGSRVVLPNPESLLSAPLGLWWGRVMFSAVVSGRTPAVKPEWPFASERLFDLYLLVLLLFHLSR